MPDQIQLVLNEYKEKIKSIFGDSLVQIILYGSYARGDFHKGSDIDIMILTTLPDDKISSYDDKVFDMTFDFNWEHDVEIMPIIKNELHFNYWKNAYMFYKNIDEEGITLV
ncbi:MAG: nucleotidyltransferase domain-containing protein [Lachnospiraceae bacterium]|nr:nucleotidyltransferase domain-containing protein [Lachnospiraceae bacterium]